MCDVCIYSSLLVTSDFDLIREFIHLAPTFWRAMAAACVASEQLTLLEKVGKDLEATPLAACGAAVVEGPTLIPVVCWEGKVHRLTDEGVPAATLQKVSLLVDITVSCPSPYGHVHDSNFDFDSQTHRVELLFCCEFPRKIPEVRFRSPIQHYYLHPETAKPGPLFEQLFCKNVDEAAPPHTRVCFGIEATLKCIQQLLAGPIEPGFLQLSGGANGCEATRVGKDVAASASPPSEVNDEKKDLQNKQERERHRQAFFHVGDDHFEMIARIAALKKYRIHNELYHCGSLRCADPRSDPKQPACSDAASESSPLHHVESQTQSTDALDDSAKFRPSTRSSAASNATSDSYNTQNAGAPFKTSEIFDPDGLWLVPELRCALGLHVSTSDGEIKSATEAGSGAIDCVKLRQLLRCEAPGVFSFPLFTDYYCRILVEELDAIAASGVPVDRPNSMNQYGVILNFVGMQGVFTRLQQEVFGPIAQVLFPNVVGESSAVMTSTKQGHSQKKPRMEDKPLPSENWGYFDSHHTFVVQYEPGKDLGLDMHTDASHVTFNACLGKEFTGAPLVFCGVQGNPTHRKQSLTYAHERGRCVVHLGQRRHGARNITTGQRHVACLCKRATTLTI